MRGYGIIRLHTYNLKSSWSKSVRKKMCVNLIAFVIFIVISDVASLDVCSIKDGKVMNVRIVLKNIV